MNIGIVELHYHSEFLNNLLQIFDKENVTVYLTRVVYDELPQESKEHNFVFKSSNQSTRHFLSIIPTNNHDLLFVNTIQPSMIDLPAYKDFKPKCKSVLTLHNLNAWHNHKFCLRANFLHSIDSYVSNFYTSKVLNNYTHINVVYSLMVDLAQQYFGKTHNIIHIPYSCAQENIIEDKKETIDFVVPGTVSKKRRNYEPITIAFDDLCAVYDNLRLILLGKNEDKVAFNEDTGAEEPIITFDERVSTIEYNEYLRHADFIIVPSYFFTHSVNTTDEYYGFTKCPNIHESIKWRKPLVVPDHLPLDQRLQPFTFKYENISHLETFLSDCLEKKKVMMNIKKSAVRDTEPFLLKNIMKNVYKELELN